jgi:DNA helicase HerA-like ATPase
LQPTKYYSQNEIFIGAAENSSGNLLLKYANRHGLIAGATGTGKTLTLQGLAEGFSKAGVPVFIADVKGDLSGISKTGVDKKPLVERAAQIGYELNYESFPTIFWDIFGKNGHPVRTTISEIGPLLLARLMQLNETQEGVLNIAFTVADEQGLLLLDLDDLRAMLNHVSENADEISQKYGNIAKPTIAAIARAILSLEQQGGKNLFGEPAISIKDLMRTNNNYGYINILSAETLMQNPKLYSSFMLWLLSELFEDLPEVGDIEKPKLVFFFDEAHLLFNDAPKILIERIEQLVRLIRSKGVGVYFITQNPADIPASVLGQLSNRFQHALRAFTPQDLKGVKAAAQSFRPNPKFKTEDAICNLAIGEALVSVLDSKGAPTIVERCLIKPPSSFVGAITDSERREIINNSPINGMYEQEVNRESAYEILNKKITEPEKSPWDILGGNSSGTKNKGGRRGDTLVETAAKTIVRTASSQIGRAIVRGILKSLIK